MNGVRRLVQSGAPWEATVGYSRAVRVGNLVYVAGTTGLDAEGRLVGPDDPLAQARQALANVARALESAGARTADVVRTRIYVTDMADWPQVARAHAEVFGEVRPAATLVQVAGLIDPAMRVEIEADAVIAETGR